MKKLVLLFSACTLFFITDQLNSIQIKKLNSNNENLISNTNSLLQSIEFVNVPAGPYTSGKDNDTLSIGYSFQIMKNCVTNSQFVDYLNAVYTEEDMNISKTIVYCRYNGDKYWKADKYQLIFLSRDGCKIKYNNNSFTVERGFENFPVVQVSWFGANAFAEYYGFRLPRKDEFEKVARGLTGWNYPWGDKIEGSHANYWNSGDPFDNAPTPVGYYNGSSHNGFQTKDSPSPYGAYDMAGNVQQWIDNYYTKTKRTERLYRIVRGGSFQGIKSEIQSWGYNDLTPWQGYPYTGFRCARSIN